MAVWRELIALARDRTLNACAALSYRGVAVSQSAFILNANIDGFNSCSALSKSSLPFCFISEMPALGMREHCNMTEYACC